MGVQRFFFAALLSGAAGLSAQTGDLKWTQEAIDSHAVTHYFDPPARRSETKWQVVKLEGCEAELRETWHREAPNSVFSREGTFGQSEDKTVTYSFDLHELRPSEILADTSTGLPYVAIFAGAGLFHTKTDNETRVVRADGSVVNTTNWSAPGNTSNLWMYFDSPDADNKAVVRRVALELQVATSKCSPAPVAKRRKSPKSVIAAALR